jgi:predicted ATPase
MLETIREYAAEQLAASGEQEEIRARHAAHFLAFAERGAGVLTDPRRDALLDQLDGELANLRAATRWSIETGELETGLLIQASLRDFWHTRNHLTEARASLGELLRVSGPGSSLSRERAFETASELASWQADYAASVSLAEQGLAMAEALGNRLGVATGKLNLGWGNLLHRPEVARQYFDEAADVARELKADQLVSGILQGGAMAYLKLGQLVRARDLAQEAIELATGSGETYIRSFNMLTLGVIDARAGDRQAALRRFREALSDSIHAGAKIGTALALESVANMAIDQGELEHAAQLASAGDRLRSEIGGGPTMAMGGQEEPLPRLRAVMDPAILERALAEGRALTTEQAAALAYSLGEPAD